MYQMRTLGYLLLVIHYTYLNYQTLLLVSLKKGGVNLLKSSCPVPIDITEIPFLRTLFLMSSFAYLFNTDIAKFKGELEKIPPSMS